MQNNWTTCEIYCNVWLLIFRDRSISFSRIIFVIAYSAVITMFWRRKVEANNLQALLLDIKEEAKEKDRELQCNELSFLPATGWPLRPALIVRYQKALTCMCAQLINEQIATLYSRWIAVHFTVESIDLTCIECNVNQKINVTAEQVMNRNYFFRN